MSVALEAVRPVKLEEIREACKRIAGMIVRTLERKVGLPLWAHAAPGTTAIPAAAISVRVTASLAAARRAPRAAARAFERIAAARGEQQRERRQGCYRKQLTHDPP